MESISSKILHSKGSYIKTEMLEKLCAAENYTEFCSEINSLEEKGVIFPVKSSGSNGKFPPLPLKFRINRPKEDYSEEIAEIKTLSPLFNISGYLKNPLLYRKHRALAQPLDSYLKFKDKELLQPMSENERAFAVWHNEKSLDNNEGLSFLHFNNMENVINTYPTPEPFFDYICCENIRTALVLENKDIWYTLRRLFRENPQKRVLFSAEIDDIILGEGRKAARKNALEEYAAALGQTQIKFLYFGDLDYAGISIYESVKETNSDADIELFLPAYKAMLARSEKLGFSDVHANQKSKDIDEFLQYFSADEAEMICKMLENKKFLPQEILNYPYLKESLTSAEGSHV